MNSSQSFGSSTLHKQQLILLPDEEIINETNGIWNLSCEQGSLGTFIMTNVRIVWFANLANNFNVSLPYIQIKNISTKNSKFGMALVIETSGDQWWLEQVYKELLSLWQVYCKNPTFGVKIERKKTEEHRDETMQGHSLKSEGQMPRASNRAQQQNSVARQPEKVEVIGDGTLHKYCAAAGKEKDAPPVFDHYLGLAVEQMPKDSPLTTEQFTIKIHQLLTSQKFSIFLIKKIYENAENKTIKKEFSLLEQSQFKQLLLELEAARVKQDLDNRLIDKLKDYFLKHDIHVIERILFLKSEINQKDDTTRKLQGENITMKKEIESFSMKENAIISNLQNEFRQQLEQLEMQHSKKWIHNKKNNKEDLETALFAAKTTIEAQAKKFQVSLEAFQSKHAIDTQRLRQTLSKELKEVRQHARDILEQEIDAESRQLRQNNKQMQEDLLFHVEILINIFINLLNENNLLLVKKLNQELTLIKDTNLEQCKKAVMDKQIIEALTKEVAVAQETIKEYQHWDNTKKSLEEKNSKELLASKGTVDSQAKQLQLITHQLKHFRKLANQLMFQRTEMEQFFHEALQEVKIKIALEKQAEHLNRLEKYPYITKQHGRALKERDNEHIEKNSLKSENLKKINPNKIRLTELSLEDKEHILKELLIKLNKSPTVNVVLMFYADLKKNKLVFTSVLWKLNLFFAEMIKKNNNNNKLISVQIGIYLFFFWKTVKRGAQRFKKKKKKER
ncbi:hypothetical protein RFI_22061 [Reticulomyxa filosa]|uniref:BBSome complex member BBS5 PH domain-containing protein n=1 Tax=Reticulomyxa filosa TaxID=46433 RepID=X6MMR6_RETFI|nr:hypothetical protein RFI_22061 [Reticulomyxa filosa]|eukprot:ETO15303.1 hypothetical protein RFI_22061 [Reticulomyxa filosa]